MSNFKMIFKMYREIQHLEKHVIPNMLLSSAINAARPFINIYFTAKLVTLLSNGADLSEVIIYICLALFLNFTFMFLSNYLADYDSGLQSMLLDRESEKMAKKLYKTEYEKLEDSEFRKIIHTH